ncbi:MAG: hypothetical protein ACLVAK_07590 [Clostridia bacterium]
MDENTINITQIIMQTINTLFENLFSSIDNNLYSIIDDITFIGPDLLHNSPFQKIFGSSPTEGFLLIANSLLFGFLIYYGIKLLLSNFTYMQLERPYQFLFKIIIFGILMNGSFFLCDQILSLVSYFTLAIREIGESLFSKSICFSTLITELNSIVSINGSSFNIFSLDGIIKSIISLGIFNLLFSYSLRYVLIQVFILLSPFAILSLSIQSTSWFFKIWFRTFLSLLALQFFIPIILILIFSLHYDSNDLFNKFIYIGGIYALIKSNFIIRDFIGGISTEVSSQLSNYSNIFKGGS